MHPERLHIQLQNNYSMKAKNIQELSKKNLSLYKNILRNPAYFYNFFGKIAVFCIWLLTEKESGDIMKMHSGRAVKG